MEKKKKTKLIQSGQYVAEVDVELIVNEDEWSPYLTIQDALKLEKVKEALNSNDLDQASNYGRIYRLEPISK